MVAAPTDPKSLHIQAWAQTDVGRRRERNEDAFLASDDLQLYVVADGMGGHAGGGLASQLAVQTIAEVIRQQIEDPDATVDDSSLAPPGPDPSAILRYAVQRASRVVYARTLQQPELRGMGTTVVVLWFRQGKAYLANVGDSRGYLVRQDRMTQLTVDHSLVGEQLRAGILSENDAKHHRYKNIITRSVGFQPGVDVDIEIRAVRPGDRIVLCSDGLTNMVTDDTLHAVVRDRTPEEICAHLIGLANQAGGEDNVTVLLCTVQGNLAAEDPDETEEWDESTIQL